MIARNRGNMAHMRGLKACCIRSEYETEGDVRESRWGAGLTRVVLGVVSVVSE